MEDDTETAQQNLCCTCLRRDRKLFRLCRLEDGVNNLYMLLFHDSEAYQEGFFKDTASLYTCWECSAIINKISKFKRQVCMAQRHQANIVDGRADIKPFKYCSDLDYHYTNNYYDNTIKECSGVKDIMPDFIDCGENQFDDMPISIVHNNVEIKDENECLANSDVLISIWEEATENNKDMLKAKQDECMNKVVGKNEINAERNKDQNESLSKQTNERRVSDERSHTHKPCSSTHSKADMDKKSEHLCTECNTYFPSKNQRWKHIQRTHRDGFRCAACGKRFAFRPNLLRHEMMHKGPPRRVECEICHKMIREDAAKVHSRIHSAREQFSCLSCDAHFVSRASYEHHLLYTMAHVTNFDKLLKHTCTMCEKRYRSKGELRDHVNYQHFGKTQHQCPVCKKALANRRCITRHVRRAHEGVSENAKNKVCEHCGKGFRDKKGLMEHEWIHTGERPLSCEECGSKFRQRSALYNHRRRLHRMEPLGKTLELEEM